MVAVPLQTLEELDLTAEEFEQLVEQGMTAVMLQTMSSEDIEEALAEGDPSALDVLLTLWAAYVAAELLPRLDASMAAAALAVLTRLSSATDNPLTPLWDQPLDTEQYLLQAQNRLVGIGNELWFNARQALAEGIAAGESQPALTARVKAAVGVSTPRARVIARTESHGARNVAAVATLQRFESEYAVGPDVMRKQWQATEDERTRHTHDEADGQTVAFGDPFTVGGFSLAFPGDPAGPPQEVINCVVGSAVIIAKDVTKAYRYQHSGLAVTITTESGAVLPVSPNHPVLTEFGWIPAEELKQGHHVIRSNVTGNLPGSKPDVQADVTTAAQIFNTLAMTGDAHRVSGSTVNFHGDIITSDIDVVATNRPLSFGIDTTQAKQFDQFGLACADAPAFSGSPEFHLSVRSSLTSDGIVCFADLISALLSAHSAPLQDFGFGLAAWRDTELVESSVDHRTADIETLRKRVDGLTGFVALDEVVNVEIEPFSGHLYSFETDSGIYFANAITSHNCRCTTFAVFDPADLNLTDNGAVITLNAAAYQEGDAMADQNTRYVSVSGPIVRGGGRKTGDRRQFDVETLAWQDEGATDASLEIPLGYQYERSHGGTNDKTARVGRIDSIERVGDELVAKGVIDLKAPWGPEAATLMGTRENPGILAGVSILIDENPDMSGLSVEFEFAEGCELASEDEEFDPACAEPERTIVTDGARIRGVDLVDIPAYAEARMYLDAELPDDIAAPEAAETLTASSYTITIPELPPAEWFAEPDEVPEIGAITVTEDGRFFGYLAPRHVAHRGYQKRRVTVPLGNVDYGMWMNRATLVDDGNGGYAKLATGPITMDCGHAPMSAAVKGAARQAHYDNTCSVVATARVGENARGVWIAGALIPGITAEQVSRMMACQLSGDWGPHREKPGKRELAGALLVPRPGFPTAHHSFSLQAGELSRTVTPVRFGTYAGVEEPVGMQAAADRIASHLGRDPQSRMREFALSLRTILKGD